MNILTGRKWRRKNSRSSKNAFATVENGTRRILIPSCVQIYNFPLSIYSVDGVPMLERVPGRASSRVRFHFCLEVSGDQNNAHAFLKGRKSDFREPYESVDTYLFGKTLFTASKTDPVYRGSSLLPKTIWKVIWNACDVTGEYYTTSNEIPIETHIDVLEKCTCEWEL